MPCRPNIYAKFMQARGLALPIERRFQEEDTMGNGTIFNAITKTDLLGIQLTEPTKEIIVKFEEVADPISLELANLTMKNATLRQTRDLLLPSSSLVK